jgi:FkbM family methyltransferase
LYRQYVGSKEEIDSTFKYEENPPWIFAETWEAAANFCKELLNDYEALQKMQDNLLYWWRTRIHKIKGKLKKILITKTIPIKVVQVGTNRGYDDLSRHLIANYDILEFALFVEPNQLHLQDIRNCYQKFDNAIIENVAIKTVLDPNKEMTIYYHLDDAPEYQIASTDLNHILNHMHLHHDEDKIKSFTVPCLTLHELFEKYNITELDWLLLDIEGLDAEILLTTDWKPYKIRRIEFEQLHLGKYGSAVYNMFIGLGYKQVNSLHEYDWAFENYKN